MNVYVNRTLNLKKIKAIGFDMDYTLIRYFTENFEHFTYQTIINKLINDKKYPEAIRDLKYDFNRAIQGLVIDKRHGNILKLSLFGKVKKSTHGTRVLSYDEQIALYSNEEIDLTENFIQSLDTSFSIAHGILYAQLVDLKDQGLITKSYEVVAHDLRDCLDTAHRDGSLKDEVQKNISKYIVQDPELPKLLEGYKADGKKLIIITNSDFNYTKLLMDYAITPFLISHKCWQDLFDITITLASKPRYFNDNLPYLKIDPKTGLMSNFYGPIENGIYQGGNAKKLQRDLGLSHSEILYLGDHIYGDVVSIKKNFTWRTGLIFAPLEDEMVSINKGRDIQEKIDQKMKEKNVLEKKLHHLYVTEYHTNKDVYRQGRNEIYVGLDAINNDISHLIEAYQKLFNPFWGELMRSGQEESLLAGQIEKYACVYMARVTDLLYRSPRTYFRPRRRVLPHEYID